MEELLDFGRCSAAVFVFDFNLMTLVLETIKSFSRADLLAANCDSDKTSICTDVGTTVLIDDADTAAEAGDEDIMLLTAGV